jgi:hypothetical protein
LADLPPPPPIRYLIGPFLAEGSATTIFGDGGTGKSLLSAAIAYSLASGMEVIRGWLPERPVDVLILDWEDDRYTWQRRLRRVGLGIGIDRIPRGIAYFRPDEVTEVPRLLEAREAGLIIIDSTERAMSPRALGADANAAIIALFAVFRSLGAAVLLIDHQPNEAGGRPYGSAFKKNATRDLFQVSSQGAGDTKHLALTNTKSNNRPLLDRIVIEAAFDPDPEGPIAFRVLKDDELASAGSLGRQPRRERRERTPKPLSLPQLYAAMALELGSAPTEAEFCYANPQATKENARKIRSRYINARS